MLVSLLLCVIRAFKFVALLPASEPSVANSSQSLVALAVSNPSPFLINSINSSLLFLITSVRQNLGKNFSTEPILIPASCARFNVLSNSFLICFPAPIISSDNFTCLSLLGPASINLNSFPDLK